MTENTWVFLSTNYLQLLLNIFIFTVLEMSPKPNITMKDEEKKSDI